MSTSIVSRASAPFVSVERFRRDPFTIGVSFFFDTGDTTNVSTQIFEFTVEDGGVPLISKRDFDRPANNRLIITLTEEEKATLSKSRYTFSLYNVTNNRTELAGIISFVAPRVNAVGVLTGPDIKVQYNTVTGAVEVAGMIILGQKGDPGPAWLNPRGAWAANTTYAIGDGVRYNGGTYRRTSAGTSGASFDASMWETVAAPGAFADARTLATLTDAPTYLGETALFNGRNYRAISSNPVVWLPGTSAGFPFTDASTGLASGTLTIQQMRDFIVDLQLVGTTAGTVYSIASVARNNSGSWYIQIFSTGTPNPYQLVAQLNTGVNPENGNNITVHNLVAANGSGVTGRIALNWSKIPVGVYYNMWGYADKNGYRLHPDITLTNRWGYLMAYDFAALQTNVTSLSSTAKPLTALTNAPDKVGQTGYLATTGKFYRAVSISPVAWLPIGSLGFPFTDGSQGNTPTSSRLSIADMRSFIVDLQLAGTVSSLTYSVAVVIRTASNWDIQVYSENGSASSTLVTRFQTAASPENGTNVTIHNLTAANNSGVTGRIAVNWSKIAIGSYYAMFGFSETHVNAGYMLHPDVLTGQRFGYLAQTDLTTNLASLNASVGPPKPLAALSDVPTSIGQSGYLATTGKFYRAVSINPVAWLSGDGFPYTGGSQGKSSLLISTMRDFLIDIQITGADSVNKVYSLGVVIRGGASWALELYETGTPTPYTLVAKFITAVNPENGNNVTIHTLSVQNSSGVTARVAVNWSKIAVGSYYSLWGHSESAASSGGYKLHPDAFINHFGYLAQYDLQNTAAGPEIVAARGIRTSLSERLSPVLSIRGLPNTPIWGREKLLRFNAWKRLQDYAYNFACFGDSFTQGGYFIGYLKDYLLNDGYSNGGAGWCGFSRWGEVAGSINGATKSAELSVAYDLTVWPKTYTSGGQLGIDGHITSNANGNQVVLTSGITHASVTVLFERHSGGAGFRFQTNGGGWTTVSTDNATQDASSVVIDTSPLAAGFTLTIEALGAGVILFGAIGRKSGTNTLTIHKCGLSGGQSTHLNASALWATNVAKLNLSGAMLMFTINEQGSNTTPATLAASYQGIINTLRAQNPLMDILIAAPTFTKYETEEPKAYSNRDYAIAAFEVAQANRCAFVDIAQVMGPFSQAQIDAGFINSDRIHPGTRGGVVIADTVYQPFKK